MILLIMVCENTAANGASEYILTHFANPVLMVFAQNHQMIEKFTDINVKYRLSSQDLRLKDDLSVFVTKKIFGTILLLQNL